MVHNQFGILIFLWLSKFTRTISFLDCDGYEYVRYESTCDKCLQKMWCGSIRDCGTIKLIFRNKDKIIQILRGNLCQHSPLSTSLKFEEVFESLNNAVFLISRLFV